MVPRLAEDECQVWWAPAAPGRRLLGLLDAAERERWERFHRPEDRALYLAAHALARLVAAALVGVAPAEVRFEATCKRCGGPHGKPRVRRPAPLELSWSHSGRRVVLAVTTAVPVGVDVEHATDRGGEPPLLALAPEEQTVLDGLDATARGTAFLRYWTRKEALLKATGDGLNVAPADVVVSPPTEPPALASWNATPALAGPAHLYDLDAPAGYLASLATLGAPRTVRALDGAPLLERAAGEPEAPCPPSPRA